MSNKNATEKVMNKIGNDIEKVLPKGFGFAVLVFPFSEPGIANYISNANRKDMITMLRETADRFEKQEEFKTPKDLLYGT